MGVVRMNGVLIGRLDVGGLRRVFDLFIPKRDVERR